MFLLAASPDCWDEDSGSQGFGTADEGRDASKALPFRFISGKCSRLYILDQARSALLHTYPTLDDDLERRDTVDGARALTGG